MTHSTRPILSASVLAALIGGCAVTDYGSTSLHSTSENALSENRLSYNRLSYNRLSYNRLSYNSLDNDIHESDDGLELLRYIVRCALDEGEVLVVDTGDDVLEMPGLLGLAPEWEDGPIGGDSQRRVSGCVIAHVNMFGVAVPVSLRYQGYLKAAADEKSDFNHYEGAFFGNLFSEDETPIYSCFGGTGPDNSTFLDTGVGDRLLRRCADEDCGPIRSLGACADLCKTSKDGQLNCKVPQGEGSDFYSNPVHVYLADWKSNDAVWPDHLSMLEDYYGVEAPEESASGKSASNN